MEDVKDMELSIRLIKSPLYECATYTPKIQVGIERITALLKLIEKNIVESKGKFKLITKPVAIGAKEEEDIENMIRQLNEQQNEDTNSRNGEEDNEEGMNVEVEGYIEESEENKTEDTDNKSKKDEGEGDSD
mmetsp:Transcript_25197/g.29040  ORF Transcript_25197/g.29040 Transcript_25197/m.29040 type:complete len:132 (-) Transcript_25197:119-514(-)